MSKPPLYSDEIQERLGMAMTYRSRDMTWRGGVRIKDLQSLMWAYHDCKRDNEHLRAVLSTPEVYAGIISEEFEKHMAALVIERDEKIRRLEAEIAQLKYPTPTRVAVYRQHDAS